jgi:hypothetical protein
VRLAARVRLARHDWLGGVLEIEWRRAGLSGRGSRAAAASEAGVPLTRRAVALAIAGALALGAAGFFVGQAVGGDSGTPQPLKPAGGVRVTAPATDATAPPLAPGTSAGTTPTVPAPTSSSETVPTVTTPTVTGPRTTCPTPQGVPPDCGTKGN